jgi:HK97 family phage portal protein
MDLITLGLTAPIARIKSLTLNPLSNASSWWPVIREPSTGAWQRNEELGASSALAYSAVYSCVRLITTDIGKMTLSLVEQHSNGVWTKTESPAFSPVLRKPNHYQSINKFIEQWILSKLLHGNAYVLKIRDNRGVVTRLHVLDPTRVTPLVSPDSAVYYELRRDDLSGLRSESVIRPASDVIHDTMITPFHPLVGVSPIYACALAAAQGLSIQGNSKSFFANGSNPGGMLTAPGAISNETAARLKDKFDGGGFSGDNAGKTVVAGDGLTYEQFTMSAVDSQLIEQLKMTAEQVCGAFGVPPYLVDIGDAPPYANFEPLLLKYHSQCIQSLTTNFEKSLDDGLGLLNKIDGKQYGTEFDIDDLIWMDTATRVASANTSIGSGGMAPDEARLRYFGLGPVPGGDTPYMQQQYWPLKQLAGRDVPVPTGVGTVRSEPPVDVDDEAPAAKAARFGAMMRRKAMGAGLAA